MQNSLLSMDQISCGQNFLIDSIDDRSALKKRLCDIGITKGATLTCLFESPLGDPVAYRVRNTVIALRRRDTGAIQGTPLE